MRSLAAFSLAALLFACAGILSAPAVHAESISDLKARLADLEAEEEENNAQLETLRGDMDQKRERGEALCAELGAVQQQLDALDSRLEQGEAEAAESSGTAEPETAETPALAAALGSAETPQGDGAAQEAAAYTLEMLEAEGASAEAAPGQLGAGRETLAESRAALRRQNTAIFALYEENLLQLRQAEQEAAQAEAKVARIAAEKEAAAAAVDVWYTEYDAALQAAGVNAGGVESAGAGGFVWPMPGYDYITCDYGDDGHRGIDIAGSEIYGQPIVAAARGEVVYSDWMDSYGYCVFIDHGNGCSTRYAHASALACSVGDVVSPGQTIAYVGSTGNSTGPHLHFEVLRAGSTTDPFDYY